MIRYIRYKLRKPSSHEASRENASVAVPLQVSALYRMKNSTNPLYALLRGFVSDVTENI